MLNLLLCFQLHPPDFHACFEVFLGGQWIIADATRLVALNKIVKIATGLDAAETAFASIFGNLRFTSMKVEFEPATSTGEEPEEETLEGKGMNLY
ncbi:hypothetical protein [Pedobacter faecalis]|uniref:hypothetical protein n=1 Tax=Pedobacter faecalis TaxID=3041495 RepID=UPI00254B95E3|nr:hypothetical protein [Pedobacter sp. ELA7]